MRILWRRCDIKRKGEAFFIQLLIDVKVLIKVVVLLTIMVGEAEEISCCYQI